MGEYESMFYGDRAEAEAVLGRLEELGYGHERISLVLDEHDVPSDAADESSVVVGAIGGSMVGALIAAAVGTVLVAGGVMVAGPLALVLTGASGLSVGLIGGSILGGLLGLGVGTDAWRDGLRRGGVGVVVTLSSDADRDRVRTVLAGGA